MNTMNLTINGKTVHAADGYSHHIWCGSIKAERGGWKKGVPTNDPVNCKRCLKNAGHKIAPAAPKTPAPDRCPGTRPVDGNPRRLYRECATCGKKVAWKNGKLRAHKA